MLKVMDISYLLLSIFGESAGNVFDRLNFKKTHIKIRQALFLGFLGMSFFIWLYIYVTDQPFPQFTLVPLLFIGGIILLSFSANVFDFLSLKSDDLSLREPVIDSYPIMAGLIGYAFFPAERQTIYLWAFIAGAIIIYWGLHHAKLRARQRKGLYFLLLAMALYAVLPTLYKEALEYVSPAYISGFRVVGILILSSLFLPIKSLKGLTPKRVGYAFASSFVCSIAAIASIYAIGAYGVVLTSLFFMLGPALRYLSGYFVLHEKVRRREIISSLMLSVVVAVTAFMS